MQKFDIKETKELVVLILGVGKSTSKSLADGKFDAADMGNFLPLIPLLQPAFEGIAKIPSEVKDLDTDELAELLALVAPEVGEIANAPKLVNQIEKALHLITAAKEFYETLK